MLKKHILSIIITAVTCLGACTVVIDRKPEQPDSPPIPTSSFSAITLHSENSQFTGELTQAMGHYDKVEVTFSGGILEPETEMPKPLTEWMVAVKNSGGKVDYEPISQEMPVDIMAWLLGALINVGIDQLLKWLDSREAPPTYQAAQHYHVRLCYRQQDNKVTKVVFFPRPEESKQYCR